MGQVPDVTCSRCRDPRFYWSIRFFPGPYAFEEILHMRNGAIAEAAFRKNGILIRATGNAFAIKGNAAAIDF